MSRILQIAWREFTATVLTKAFLLGLLMVPAMIGLVALLVPWIVKQDQSVAFEGRVLLLDPTGVLAGPLRATLSPEAFAARRAEVAERLADFASANLPTKTLPAASDAYRAAAPVDGTVPRFDLVEVPVGMSLEALQQRLRGARPEAFALVVVDAGALRTGSVPPYTLYVGEGIEDRVLDSLRDGLGRGLVDARLAQQGLDPGEIRALMRLPRIEPHRVDASAGGGELVARLLPLAFMMLLFAAVMTSGQMLMTSTIEEKSSRVVELLLAAVSPTELMAGKVLGQLGVASLMMALYAGLGLFALATFAALGLVEPLMLVYLAIFFLIAFVTLAALMAAIGAAVNELREAQALLTPVMLVVMLPMMLWLPISRDPNSLFATVLSLTPPVSPFVMILRMTSSSPPPDWQVWGAILLGLVGVALALWFAGKVFRIGLLMHGKPPNLVTLWRWVRMS